MENIDSLLKFDALTEAEKITGNSYKEDESTSHLGLAMHINQVRIKNDALKSMGDTTMSTPEIEYLEIAKSIGFESVLIEPFENEKGITERLHVLWHDEYSILLCFDTYSYDDDGSWAKSGEKVPLPNVNSGNFYYNIKLKDVDNRHEVTSSGGLNDDMIWSGNHDCREALKHHVSKLSESGTFLQSWVDQPFLWLINYMDTKNDNYDYESLNASRISKLPRNIQDRISVNS